MRRFFVIWCREFGSCFLAPVAYVTMVVFLSACGLTFMWTASRSEGADDPLSVILILSIVVWLPVLITVICMRLFTEERRSGTIETLMTAPVTEAQVVLGKYAGALTFVLLVSLPAVANIYFLSTISPGMTPSQIDIGAVSGGCIFLVLMAGLWVAAGLFMSVLTRNQTIAAICTFSVVWLILLAGWLLTTLPIGLEEVGRYVSCLEHLDTMSRGIIDGRPVVLFVTATALILFASVKVLQLKRWR